MEEHTLEGTPFEFEEIDCARWPRREHFEFFASYSEPFFSITSDVDCSGLVKRCRQQDRSPTFALWHGVLTAAQRVPEFRTRILEDRVVSFKRVHQSPTVLRSDRTFGVGFLPYIEDGERFQELARGVVDEVKRSTGFQLREGRRVDLVHFSTVPWFRFTGLNHARARIAGESEPKITLGKFSEVEPGKFQIPVSVMAHHGLVDGFQVAEYLQTLGSLWNE